jgi:hypothetical protein
MAGRLCLLTEATAESDLPYPICPSQAFLMSTVTPYVSGPFHSAVVNIKDTAVVY